ncbi:response regulator transcription factor [Paraburkholderia phymatum]|uniref:Two component transcriptional regulator, LuxR family n=1 Tax=Paraburkholderia phymatum (strain DSM 17167 / CIP 108236 / LMG 21445 / STM815) TaxID=391038 RepID=B2JCS9_PARP8|nr:response regulator transcription factor [Paraburkholderia phymatum]ACC69548.1 two component transcriptional regulator, LuxR family [Paraburkholderia phymatum STM815]
MNIRKDGTLPIRTIIADDHPLVLLAMENLMSGFPNIEIVGKATDSSELFAEAQRVKCELVVMDLYMPGGLHGDGVEMVRQFKERHPDVVVVVLTMETSADALQKVIALGVGAVVSKRDRIDLIHVAIITALARECYVGPAIRALLADATLSRRIDYVRQVLSRRELEVLTHYATGRGVTEIAMRLGRSVKTISAQKCTAMRKLSLQSDADLFRFAVEHGLVTDEQSTAAGRTGGRG